MEYNCSSAYATQLDQKDALASFRSAFAIDDPDLIYMDGNSLGRLPKSSRERLHEVIDDAWGRKLINSWGDSWFEAPRRLGGLVAQLMGAQPEEVLVSDSTTINLFKLAMAALLAQPGRKRIVSDTLNFPTDLYVLQNCIKMLDSAHSLGLVDSRDGIHIYPEDVEQLIDEDTALMTFSTPTFKSGFLHDVEEITRIGHRAGALVLWDLSHCTGVVPLELDAWKVDLAVGCTYKYLNGGPGSPAYLYVRNEIMQDLPSVFSGWWGHQSPFSFDLAFHPSDDIGKFMAGTPPVLSMMAIEPALELTIRAGIGRIREKSVLLTGYLIALYDTVLAPLGFELGTPRDSAQRGSHVSLQHPDGYRICQALIQEMKVIPDFREPDHIRLGLAPLYNSFMDVWQAVDRIREVVEEEKHLEYSTDRQAVT